MPLTLRRLLLWTIVCTVSAAPSFVVAHDHFNVSAMVSAVALFVCLYTAFTSTERFGRIYRRPFVRRTMYIGYGFRMLVSIAIPVGISADLGPGILSVGFVEKFLNIPTNTFAGTFLITCTQGTLLNLILLIFMLIVQGIQRMFCKPPEEPRGFQVIMPPAPLPAQPVGDGAANG